MWSILDPELPALIPCWESCFQLKTRYQREDASHSIFERASKVGTQNVGLNKVDLQSRYCEVIEDRWYDWKPKFILNYLEGDCNTRFFRHLLKYTRFFHTVETRERCPNDLWKVVHDGQASPSQGWLMPILTRIFKLSFQNVENLSFWRG